MEDDENQTMLRSTASQVVDGPLPLFGTSPVSMRAADPRRPEPGLDRELGAASTLQVNAGPPPMFGFGEQHHFDRLA